jgi:hypothetical protein
MFALNSYQTLAVGILLYYLGKWLKSKIKFFQTYCIPNPVIGGVLFALINLALFEAGSGAIKLDTVQQSFFMNMFFTSVGFSASYALLKKGRPGRSVPDHHLRRLDYLPGYHRCSPGQGYGSATAAGPVRRFHSYGRGARYLRRLWSHAGRHWR